MSLRSRISQATNALFGREQRNVPLALEAWYHQYGLAHPFKPEESLKAYGDNPWLASAIDKHAHELARTKFHLQRTNAKGEIEIVRKHQALETLRFPQPIKGGKSLLTSFDLKLVTAYHLCLVGEAFWILDKRLRSGGAPTMIDLLLPQYVYQRINNGELTAYVYRLPDREITLDPMDVVHFKLPSPEKWQRGAPPLQSLRWALDTHKEADIRNLKHIMNGAIPGGTIETEQNVPEAERRKILNEWQQRYGGSENANKTAMLPNGLKFSKVQESNADIQYVEGKQTNRTEILARYGVGPEILGLTESQTRANAEAAIFVFMKFGASFFIEKFADTLNNEFLPAFPGVDALEFGFPDPVPENMEEKRLNAQALWAIGAATPNEVRKMFGQEPSNQPGMDDFYMDMGKVPLGADPPSLAA